MAKSKRKQQRQKARKRSTRKSAPRRAERSYPVPKKKKKKRSVVVVASKKRKGRRGAPRSTLGGIVPPKNELMDMAGAAAYGWAETKAAKEKDFALNKVPKPITALGYAGNVALALRLMYHFGLKHPAVLHAARGTACVAAYQMGALGRVFEKDEAEKADAFKTAKVAMSDGAASDTTAQTAAPSSAAAATSGMGDDDDLDVSGLADEGDAIGAALDEDDDDEVGADEDDDDDEVGAADDDQGGFQGIDGLPVLMNEAA